MSLKLRVLDVILALSGMIILMPVFVFLLIAAYFDTGSPLFLQQRVGRREKLFVLVKFRTMRPETANVPTHLADSSAVTQLGRVLRRTKLDELPQLWNVFKGEMSLVGPRPCLPTQIQLIEERRARGVFDARPGITGLAQVRGVDMSTPILLAKTDQQMLTELGPSSYAKYVVLTIAGRGAGDCIKEQSK